MADEEGDSECQVWPPESCCSWGCNSSHERSSFKLSPGILEKLLLKLACGEERGEVRCFFKEIGG